MDGWKKWPDGHLVINSVLGWETATATGTALVRLVYAGSPDDEKAGGRQLQLAMSVPQVESLIRDLTTTLTSLREKEQGTGA